MRRSAPFFRDRTEAGRLLGAALAALDLEDVVVYALPRGGAPIGLEVARALGAPLDLALVRKIGAPGEPELALGAVVDGKNPHLVLNEDVARLTGADEAFLRAAEARELAEIERRRALYFGNRPRIDPAGKTAVVVDDGLATGATARAAVQGLRGQGARRIILATPVAPPETAADLRREVDEFVCLAEPRPFYGVGAFYQNFRQIEDGQVIEALTEARRNLVEKASNAP